VLVKIFTIGFEDERIMEEGGLPTVSGAIPNTEA
jgi:hypothetical protein